MLIFGVLHLLLPVFIVLYTFLAPLKYDQYMFFYVVILTAHWVFCRGECVLSYLYKKYYDKTYMMGKSKSLKDIIEVIVFIEKKTGIPFKVLRFLLDVLNYGGLIAVMTRFYMYKTIQPQYLIFIYVIMTVLWIGLLKVRITYHVYDCVYFFTLITIAVYGLTYTNIDTSTIQTITSY